MKKNILLIIYLIASVNFAHAQVLESLNCVTLKNAADTAYMAYETENASMLKGSSYDEEKMYETIYTYFRYSKPLIEKNCLEEDEREVLIQRLNSEYRLLVTAAPYYYLKGEYEKAVEYCRIYLQFRGSPIVTAENRETSASWFVDYYAAISSINTDNHQRTIILLEWLITKGISVEGMYELEGIYYYLAEEYLKIGDKNKYKEVLEAWMKRFPNDKTYFTAVVVEHYMNIGDHESALKYIDELLEKTDRRSREYTTYLHIKASIFVRKKEYETAEILYKKGLKKHPGRVH